MKITFKDFDMNEVTDHFDFMDPKQWRKVDRFVVLSSDDLDTGRVVKKIAEEIATKLQPWMQA